MKRIKNFSNYDDLDFISESRVYFLMDLSRKLVELHEEGNEWAMKILQAQTKDIDSDTTFLNLDGENLSFSKQSDLLKILDPRDYESLFSDDIDQHYPQRISHYLGSYHQNHISNLSNRGKVKIGRIIKKLVPEIPDKDLEIIVNALRTETTGYEIKIVSGPEIAKYYTRGACDQKLLRYGTLNSSCMMDKADEKPYIFDIYTKNPEVCQLAVMLNSNGQLVGRALVWKIQEIGRWDNTQKFIPKSAAQETEEFYKNFDVNWERVKIEPYDNDFLRAKTNELYFMDRVYYTKDWMENSFQKWAKEKNFMMKIGDSISYKGKSSYPILKVGVKKIAYRQFPYMDTFKNYDVQSSALCNYDLTSRGFDLTSTSGDYDAKGSRGEKTIDKATNYIRRFKDFFN